MPHVACVFIEFLIFNFNFVLFELDKGNHFEIGPRINGVQSRRTSPGNCHPWAHYLNLCWNGCERFQHYDNGKNFICSYF